MLDLSQGNARNESYSSQSNILSEPNQLTANTMRVTDRVAGLEQVMRPNTQPLISNLSFVLANSLNKRAAAPGCSVENAISVGPTNTSFNTV